MPGGDGGGVGVGVAGRTTGKDGGDEEHKKGKTQKG